MIAENKAEFFEQLGVELKRLGVEETTELMSDFEEHFSEGTRRGLSEEEVCRELGNIREIARSCLDIKSSMINSMVARDVQRKKVSLTKPGRSVPADPSLAASSDSVSKQDEDCVRPYTPEHSSAEIFPNAHPNDNSDAGTSENANANGAANSGGSGASTGTGANAGGNASNTKGGTFEKIGKTVDEVCDKAGKALNNAFGKAEDAMNKAGKTVGGAMGKAGDAVGDAMNKAGKAVGDAARQFRPSDSYRKHTSKDRRGGDIPPQFTKAKTNGGYKFVDVSGMKPNVNKGKLTFEVVLDVLLWLWVLPAVCAAVLAVFAGAGALAVQGVYCAVGNGAFYEFVFITRIFFTVGFFALATAVFNIGLLLFKAAMSLVRYIITRHVKAIYDI